MSKTFFGFALADGMFRGDCTIVRRSLTVEQVREKVADGIDSCCNPSHIATINAMRARFTLDVAIPATPPQVSLGSGDSVIVMGVGGLPRRPARHGHTGGEGAKATFVFSEYTVA